MDLVGNFTDSCGVPLLRDLLLNCVMIGEIDQAEETGVQGQRGFGMAGEFRIMVDKNTTRQTPPSSISLIVPYPTASSPKVRADYGVGQSSCD